MTGIQKYDVADGVRKICQAFDFSPAQVLRRAELPADILDGDGRAVTQAEFYRLWEAMAEEAMARGDPQFPKRLSDAFLSEGYDSSVFSFLSSPTVRAGLQRKAYLKSLIMPLRLEFSDTGDTFELRFLSSDPSTPLPALIGWFEAVFFVNAMRVGTGVRIEPLRVEITGPVKGTEEFDAFLGCPVNIGSIARVVLKAGDVDLPMVGQDNTLWKAFQTDAQASFALQFVQGSMGYRVRQALLEGLPGGQVTADQIAGVLAVSKRTLQRKLTKEGTSFRAILDDTRHALAVNYLRQSRIGVQEVSYLLGFRDPSSFFRAFRGWTGQSPQVFRAG